MDKLSHMNYVELPQLVQKILSEAIVIPFDERVLKFRAKEIEKVVKQTVNAQVKLYEQLSRLN